MKGSFSNVKDKDRCISQYITKQLYSAHIKWVKGCNFKKLIPIAEGKKSYQSPENITSLSHLGFQH